MVLSQDKIDRILELARSGHTMTEIQRAVGVHSTTVHTHIDREGIVLPHKELLWTQQQIDQCIQLYRDEQKTIHQVCQLMGVSHKTVSKCLRIANIEHRGQGRLGSENYFWKTGRIVDRAGYILVYAPDHPYRNHQNKVREHRLVMERKLGRYLEPGEVVDHRNGVTDDNRPENLRLFASNAEHLRATLKGRCPKWTEEGKRKIRYAKTVAALRRRHAHSILCAALSQ